MSGHRKFGQVTKNDYYDRTERKYGDRCRRIDMHEVMKKEVSRQGEGSIDGGSNYKFSSLPPQNCQYPQNPQTGGGLIPQPILPPVPVPTRDEIGVFDNYFQFDSYDKTGADYAAGEMTFSISELNNQFPIENIIEMEIGSFYIQDRPLAATLPAFYFYNRYIMAIKQLTTTQSIQGPDNLRYHFEFDVETAGISRKMNPVEIFKTFIFTKPVRDLSEITFQFRKGDGTRVSLERDVLSFTSDPGTADEMILDGLADHELDTTTTYAVFVEGFSSTNATQNTLMNRSEGHLVTVPSATRIKFDSTAGLAFAAIAATSATVKIAVRRIAIPMRFRSIVDYITNYIAP